MLAVGFCPSEGVFGISEVVGEHCGGKVRRNVDGFCQGCLKILFFSGHKFVERESGLQPHGDMAAEGEMEEEEGGGAEEGDEDAEDEQDEAGGAFGLIALFLTEVEEEEAGDERREDEHGEVDYHI